MSGGCYRKAIRAGASWALVLSGLPRPQEDVDQQHLPDGDSGERIFEDHGALPSGPIGAFGKCWKHPILLTRASARYVF
jgi:hypothetical protein